ncbi:MAG: membrane protein insertion efficiency factor YidD [Clostridia bacterium]|nr:membrane protein insertion efficiency factor YidD [Clostridia bacterium]MBQ6905589.1 membrane protein insertion efficiency factor YidD [Clostridia bacterium]
MKYIFIFFIKLYRKFISPLKKPSCRFTPTCSQYALEAFREHGAIYGLFLTCDRILRCNPYSLGGYDPVPLRAKKKNSGDIDLENKEE